MEMNGEYRIEASREKVWAALNDTEILKKSIPGCEEINRLSETEMTATVVAKVGPVKAKFTGQVTLSDLNPPNSYRISGEGKGGAAGFAKGGANVSLESDGDSTILSYSVDATVGGKLAQLGARLIDGTAKKLAGDLNSIFDFIEKLNELDTDKVEPLTSIAETSLKFRTDEVKSKNIRNKILKNSPEENEDFFVVPKVVE